MMKHLLRTLGMALVLTLAVAAQTQVFEAADVHASAPSPNAFQRSVVRGTRYEIRNATMLDLILIAYTTDGEKMLGRAAGKAIRRKVCRRVAPAFLATSR